MFADMVPGLVLKIKRVHSTNLNERWEILLFYLKMYYLQMLTFEVRERVATRPEYLFLIERLSGIRQTKTEICSNIKD